MRERRETRVLIVDAQPVMRDGIAANLSSEEGIAVVAQTGDPLEAVAAAERLRPDVVLLDLSLVERHGEWLVGRLAEGDHAPRVVVLSSLESDDWVARALRAGATSHLRKDLFREELIEAVRARPIVPPSHDGSAPLEDAGAGGAVPVASHGAPFSGREIEVLQLIARGKSDAEIAASLGVSESTVKTHVASILRKSGSRGRTQAAIRALRQGDIHL